MSGRTPRQLALWLLAAVLLLAGGGFVRGLLPQDDASRKRGDGEAEEPPVEALRDPALALRTLGAHGHWGRYTPREDEPIADAGATPPAIAAGALESAWRLVGIEYRGARPVALLLPAAATDGSADVIRLGTGETLTEGVSVSAIARDSVRFTTPGGGSTLHLYGNEP